MSAHASNDSRMGMLWWNACSQATRERWLAASGSAVPALAWECFKRSSARPQATATQFRVTTRAQVGAMQSAQGEIQWHRIPYTDRM
jgi:hypothetical protein